MALCIEDVSLSKNSSKKIQMGSITDFIVSLPKTRFLAVNGIHTRTFVKGFESFKALHKLEVMTS